jgi:hypothetical protein
MAPKIYAAKVEDVGQPITVTVAKKPRTEKQIAGDEKAKRTREAKAASKTPPANIPETSEETPKSPISLDEKVEKPPRKRAKKSVDAQPKATENIEALIDEALSEQAPIKKEKKAKSMTPPPSLDGENKVEKKVTFKDDSQPPTWFKSYIQGIREEEALLSANKISKKATKALANDEANAKWQEPVTRERVNRSVDLHMQKMYSMVFPNRKF